MAIRSRGEPRSGNGSSSLAVRVALTLLGGAGMIVGSYLVWLRRPSYTGVHLNHRIYYKFYLSSGPRLDEAFGAGNSKLVTSAGIVTIALGVVALLGLAFSRGWLTTLAGLAGIVAIVLFALTLIGANLDPKLHIGSEMGAGAVLVLAGGILAAVGGLFGRRRRGATAPPGG